MKKRKQILAAYERRKKNYSSCQEMLGRVYTPPVADKPAMSCHATRFEFVVFTFFKTNFCDYKSDFKREKK